MTRRALFVLAGLILAAGMTAAAQSTPAPAPDITGKWQASFETQIGVQNYTYEFAIKDGALTGTASSDNGVSVLKDLVRDGETLTFTEVLTFQEMEIPITYTGKITSADEIAFTREVGEFATEQLVAKRVRPE